MLDGRTRRRTPAFVLVCAAVLSGLLLVVPQSSYADPKPTIPEVKARVDSLYHQAEVASERYNTVRERMHRAQQHLATVRSDVERQAAKVAAMQQRVASLVVEQSQGSNLSTTTQLLLSRDPSQFLSQLATVQAYNGQQSDLLTSFANQRRVLQIRRAQAHRELQAIAEQKRQLAEAKKQIEAKASQAKQLLAHLREQARQRLLAAQAATTVPEPSRSGGHPVAPPAAPASGQAEIAVQFALAQIGDPYVYGGAGPDAWDCSGLTMGAWGAAGVALPHSASGQTASGTPVSASELQPGDLVFYYSPISHVALYIGNGQVVHAPHPGESVQVAPLYSMPYTEAVRPG